VKNKVLIGLSVGGAIAGVYLTCTLRVQPEHWVVFQKRGGEIQKESFGEGLYLYNPLSSIPFVFNSKKQVKIIHMKTVGTIDFFAFDIVLQIEYIPDLSKLPEMLTILGVDYEENALPKMGTEVVKGIILDMKKSEVDNETRQISEKVNSRLKSKLKESHILLESASLAFTAVEEEDLKRRTTLMMEELGLKMEV